jgi:hyaluronoglucosaminidase
VRGIIEGFYGPPWSWDDRRAVCASLAPAGMDTYVYAPKDDPLHRERWREPYDDGFLRDLAELVEDDTLRVGFAISPGLSMDPADHGDRAELLGKLEPVLEQGVTLVGLLLDDIPPADGLGDAHGHLTQWLRDALPAEVELFMVPLHYTGVAATPYLEQLSVRVPEEVAVGWTGPHVVNDAIRVADAEAWADVMGGRRPLLWDNTPCNDVVMSDRLHLGPLRGRDPELPNHLAGYLANPMQQAAASVPPLLSAAAWLRGDDAGDAGERAIGPAAVLAEACDPQALPELCEGAIAGDEQAAGDLAAFLRVASGCGDGGLGHGVEPWVAQVRAEASVAALALDAIRRPLAEAAAILPVLVLLWPPLRRSEVSVFGGRGGMRPMMGQDERSDWYSAAGAWIPPASVVDRLVAAAHARLSPG